MEGGQVIYSVVSKNIMVFNMEIKQGCEDVQWNIKQLNISHVCDGG